MFNLPHWLTNCDWQIEVRGVYLSIGTPDERQCDILTCRVCRKAKISYGCYPPRRMPRYPPGDPAQRLALTNGESNG